MCARGSLRQVYREGNPCAASIIVLGKPAQKLNAFRRFGSASANDLKVGLTRSHLFAAFATTSTTLAARVSGSKFLGEIKQDWRMGVLVQLSYHSAWVELQT